jgi:hypothetical protein
MTINRAAMPIRAVNASPSSTAAAMAVTSGTASCTVAARQIVNDGKAAYQSV